MSFEFIVFIILSVCYSIAMLWNIAMDFIKWLGK
jgi:hypothetical protein